MIPVISKSRGFKSRDFPDETRLKKHDYWLKRIRP